VSDRDFVFDPDYDYVIVKREDVIERMPEAEARELLQAALEEAGGDPARIFAPLAPGETAGDVIAPYARALASGEMVLVNISDPVAWVKGRDRG
jgi:hypothetical protein